MAGYMGEYLETRLEDFTEYDNTSDISRASTGSCTTDSSISSVPSSKHWTSRLERIPHYKYIRFPNPIDEPFTLASYPFFNTNEPLDEVYRNFYSANSMTDLIQSMKWGLEDYKLKKEYKTRSISRKPRSDISTSYMQDDSAKDIRSTMESLSLRDCELQLARELENLKFRFTLKNGNVNVRQCSKIPPSCPNFLHVACLTLRPFYAEDPFIYFGIEIRRVDGLEKIYDIEGLSKKNLITRDKFHVSKVAKITTEFIRSMLQEYSVDDECDKRQPIIQRIAASVYAFKNTQTKKFTNKLKECNSDTVRLMELLTDLAQMFETEIPKEAQLHAFILNLLNIEDGIKCLGFPVSRRLPQFKWVIGDCSVGQHCTTDLEYREKTEKEIHIFCPIEVKVKEALIKVVEGDTLCIDANLLFQCWKQAYAASISRQYPEGQTKNVVLQGCTIIVGEWVTTCVLCICMEDHTELKKIDNALKMVEWIKSRTKMTGYAWCRLYVDTHRDNLLDVIHLQKYIYKNFCTCVDRNL